MSTESRELKLYIDNDGQLYRQQKQPIVDNLLKKKNAGTYDHQKSIKLWGYLAESGAKKYARDFGGTWNQIFSPADRRETAHQLASDFDAEYKAGEYRLRQNELRTKKQRAKMEKTLAEIKGGKVGLIGTKKKVKKPASKKAQRKDMNAYMKKHYGV